MPLPVLAALPDDLLTWEGNIHELAAKCDELRPAFNLVDDLGQALTHALREERLRNKGGRT